VTKLFITEDEFLKESVCGRVTKHKLNVIVLKIIDFEFEVLLCCFPEIFNEFIMIFLFIFGRFNDVKAFEEHFKMKWITE